MQYTNKGDLRPILIRGRKKAFFHRWFKKVGEDSGEEYIWAIVELEDGTIEEAGAFDIKFLDREKN